MIQQSMALWIAHYGYPAIFLLLIGGIVGFPVPDQLLLIISGYLILTGSLSMTPTLIAAVLGSICGITLSYLLGRGSGSYLAKRRFAAHRLQNARNCFERFGGSTLVFGYFVRPVAIAAAGRPRTERSRRISRARRARRSPRGSSCRPRPRRRPASYRSRPGTG